LSKIGRAEAGDTEEIAGVIESHQNHNHTAQDIDGFEAEPAQSGIVIACR
jgi:hypothetical protein